MNSQLEEEKRTSCEKGDVLEQQSRRNAPNVGVAKEIGAAKRFAIVGSRQNEAELEQTPNPHAPDGVAENRVASLRSVVFDRLRDEF